VTAYNFSTVSDERGLQHPGVRCDPIPAQGGIMAELSISYFAARIEELRRDWPLLIADADIGQRLCAEIETLDQAMRTLLRAQVPVPIEA
jgi:hypothetical protein